MAKLTPGSVSYYIVKIRGKLESGLTVKTVSITAVDDTGSRGEKRDGVWQPASLVRGDAFTTPAQRTMRRGATLTKYFSVVIF